MRHELSAFLFICGIMFLLMGIIDNTGIFLFGLFVCLVSWAIYPKGKKPKDDGGKSLRDNKTWNN